MPEGENHLTNKPHFSASIVFDLYFGDRAAQKGKEKLQDENELCSLLPPID